MNFFLILIVFFSIVLHEYAHGWVAYKLGDPTPKNLGRLTFNPLAHIDIFGTIILPFIFFILTRGTYSFGYAKPIPINPYNFKKFKKDTMWVAIVGPLANILLALLLILILKIFSLERNLTKIFLSATIINLVLAIFNLLPIPPLDGSRIVSAFLPYRLAYLYGKIEKFGFVIIIFLILVGIFDWLIIPLLNLIFYFLKIKLFI